LPLAGFRAKLGLNGNRSAAGAIRVPDERAGNMHEQIDFFFGDR